MTAGGCSRLTVAVTGLLERAQVWQQQQGEVWEFCLPRPISTQGDPPAHGQITLIRISTTSH